MASKINSIFCVFARNYTV